MNHDSKASRKPHLILDVGGTLVERALPGAKTRALTWLLDARPKCDAAVCREAVANSVLTAAEAQTAAAELAERFQLSRSEQTTLQGVLTADEGPAHLLPGVLELLQSAKSFGWCITFATNCCGWSLPLPDVLTAFCDHYIASSKVGYLKQDIRFWQALINLTMVEPTMALVLGNSETADVAPARAADFAALRVAPASGDLFRIANTLACAGSPPSSAVGVAVGERTVWGGHTVVEAPNLHALVERVTRCKVVLLTANDARRTTIVRRKNLCPALLSSPGTDNLLFAWVVEREDPRWKAIPRDLMAALAAADIDPNEISAGLRRQVSAMISEAKDPAIRSSRIADAVSLLGSKCKE